MPNSAPSSKILMKTNQKDFETSYDRCCALNGTYPLRSVKAFVENGIVDINGDKLEFEGTRDVNQFNAVYSAICCTFHTVKDPIHLFVL